MFTSPVPQTPAARILQCLEAVERERARRRADSRLDERVVAIKTYQQARFFDSYHDLLADPRWAAAARFFLEELYGPRDFSRRDAQFARIVPTLGRLFSDEIVQTVSLLADLHALSESLDTVMGDLLPSPIIDRERYAIAWQATGRAEDRERQIALAVSIAQQLHRHTRRPMLTAGLKMMRGPARAAGLGELQQFLETGFDTFKAMTDLDGFLETVAARERDFAVRLFGLNDAKSLAQSP